MLRRVQCTYPKLTGLAVVTAAFFIVSCGGDGLTGPSPVDVTPDPVAAQPPPMELEEAEALLESDDGGPVDASCRGNKVLLCHKGRSVWVKRKAVKGHLRHGDSLGRCQGGDSRVLLCHKGRNKRVPKRAVKAHLRHGDTLGKCGQQPPAATCPCFTANDIGTAAGTCSSQVTATCSTGDPYYLFLGCDPGGSVPPGVIGVYLSQTADGGYCSRDDVSGTLSRTGLSDAEYQACVDAISGSGYCS